MSIMMFSFRGKIKFFDYGNNIFLCDADIYTTTGIHVKRLTDKQVSSSVIASNGKIIIGICNEFVRIDVFKNVGGEHYEF